MTEERSMQPGDEGADAPPTDTETATPSESGGRSWQAEAMTPADDEGMDRVEPADSAPASDHPKGRDLADRS